MNVEQKLVSVREINDLINRKLDEVAGLRGMLGASAVSYDADRVQTSPADKMSEIIGRIVDLESEINDLVDTFVDVKDECVKMLESLEDQKMVDVMKLYYLELIPMTKVAAYLGMSRRWCYDMREKSLIILNQRFR